MLKATGALYKYVLKNLGVKADKVLHIGDNMRSDIDAAKKIGISAVFYSKIIDKYFAMNYRAKDFYNKNKRFFYPSILLGTIALFLHNNGLLKEDLNDEEYWYKLGVEYSAPLAFTFSKWLNVKFKEDGIEEERRLCYVAITRAKERLYITNAKRRMLFGNTNMNPPSRFIGEIDPNLIDKEDS